MHFDTVFWVLKCMMCSHSSKLELSNNRFKITIIKRSNKSVVPTFKTLQSIVLMIFNSLNQKKQFLHSIICTFGFQKKVLVRTFYQKFLNKNLAVRLTMC